MTGYDLYFPDEVERLLKLARAEERERCAKLVREFGGLSAREAARRRVPTRGLIFKYVSAYNEQIAKLHDAAVFTCARLSECILAGYEPLGDPDEKIDLDKSNRLDLEDECMSRPKTGGITGGAGREPDKSPAGSAVAEDAPPRPAREQGTADTNDVPKPGEWQPCIACTDWQHCGSWACCAYPDAPRLRTQQL